MLEDTRHDDYPVFGVALPPVFTLYTDHTHMGVILCVSVPEGGKGGERGAQGARKSRTRGGGCGGQGEEGGFAPNFPVFTLYTGPSIFVSGVNTDSGFLIHVTPPL